MTGEGMLEGLGELDGVVEGVGEFEHEMYTGATL